MSRLSTRQIALGGNGLPHSEQMRQILALVVGRSASVNLVALNTRLKGRRIPQVERINRALGSFRAMMADEPGGFRLASAGAFFGWAQHPFTDLATDEVIKRLVLDHDVLAIPGTAFTPTDERWVRFSYANLGADQFGELASRLNEMG